MSKWNDMLEHAIIGKLVETMIDNGFRVSFCDQDGGGLFMYAMPDAAEFPKGRVNYWVQITVGNGADIITDYTTNLEEILKPVNEFAQQYRD